MQSFSQKNIFEYFLPTWEFKANGDRWNAVLTIDVEFHT